MRNFLFLATIAFLISTGCKTNQEAEGIKAKAVEAQQELKIALTNNKDASAQIVKMKQVEKLGKGGKLKQADALLDEILLDFKKINSITHEENQLFANPRRVNIKGNPYNAMEPFITRDGKILFFNSYKDDTPKTNKDIYYATRIDDVTFQFKGEVKGINSNEVDGVPTLDIHNNFYYVSTVDYSKKNNFATVYKGIYLNGQVKNISVVPELSLEKPGWLNMDIEISADGQTLYSTQTLFKGNTWPVKSYFFSARLEKGLFKTNEDSEMIFSEINTDNLEYAASISTDELDLFFTRADINNGPSFATYYASRPNKSAPFGKPTKINAIAGFSEAPAITNDGQLLYYHKQDAGRFYIYVLERRPIQ